MDDIPNFTLYDSVLELPDDSYAINDSKADSSIHFNDTSYLGTQNEPLESTNFNSDISQNLPLRR